MEDNIEERIGLIEMEFKRPENISINETIKDFRKITGVD